MEDRERRAIRRSLMRRFPVEAASMVVKTAGTALILLVTFPALRSTWFIWCCWGIFGAATLALTVRIPRVCIDDIDNINGEVHTPWRCVANLGAVTLAFALLAHWFV